MLWLLVNRRRSDGIDELVEESELIDVRGVVILGVNFVERRYSITRRRCLVCTAARARWAWPVDDLVGSGDARGGEARGDEGENGSGSDSARRGSKRCAGSAY